MRDIGKAFFVLMCSAAFALISGWFWGWTTPETIRFMMMHWIMMVHVDAMRMIRESKNAA